MRSKKMKMKTVNRQLAITALGALAGVCAFLGFSVYRADAATATAGISSFTTLSGASVRLDPETTGIRFVAQFDETLYNAVENDENKQFGMLITKYDYYAQAGDGDLIAGLDALGANKYVLITETQTTAPIIPYAYSENGETGYRINGVLTNIRYEHIDWRWIGVGVVITSEGDFDAYEYAQVSAENSRTISYVASAALNDFEKYTSEEQGILRDYVYKTAAKVTGATEAEYAAATDKASYLAPFELKTEQTEAYLRVGEKQTFSVRAEDKEKRAIDVAIDATSEQETVTVSGNEVTAMKNGYAKILFSSSLFEKTEALTVYTGSEQLFDSPSAIYSNLSNHTAFLSETGEKAGGGYIAAMTAGTGTYARSRICLYPNNVSAKWLDYMETQGYSYVRHTVYVESDSLPSWSMLFGIHGNLTGKKGADGGPAETTYTYKNVPTNVWVTVDIPLEMYRYFFGANTECTDATAALNEYGFVTGIKSGYYHTNFMINLASGTGKYYFSAPELVKESEFVLTENTESVEAFKELDLSQKYATNLRASYLLDGKLTQPDVIPVLKKHTVTVEPNLYTIAVNSIVPSADQSSWIVSQTKAASTEKELIARGGVDMQAVTLYDTEAITGTISLAAATGATALEEAGYTLSFSTVKRYGDGTPTTGGSLPQSSDSGIYYVDITAEKGNYSFGLSTTLDLYKTSEGVEYESFSHSDSSYAVSAFNTTWDTVRYDTYRGIANVPGAPAYKKDVTTENGLMTLSLYDTEKPTNENGIYVKARHTKEYYQMFENTHGVWDATVSYISNVEEESSSSIGSFMILKAILMRQEGDSDYVAGYLKKTGVRTDLSVYKGKTTSYDFSKVSSVTVSDIVANYDMFANGTVSLICGWSLSRNDHTITLSSITFLPNA